MLQVKQANSFDRKKTNTYIAGKMHNIRSLSSNSIFLLCRIPPDVKSRVMCTGIRESRSDTWDKLFNRMASQTPSDQTIILSALGCSREHWVLER